MTELKQIALKRATEHARNALHLVFQPQKKTHGDGRDGATARRAIGWPGAIALRLGPH